MSRVIHRPRSGIAAGPRGRRLLAVLGLAVAVLALPAAASAAKTAAGPFGALFGLSTAKDGSLLVADASQGIVSIRGGERTLFAALPGVTDVAAVGNGVVFAITGGGGPEGEPPPGAASLYRISNGHAQLVADLGAFEADVNPHPDLVESNPFGLTALNGGGVLIADAAGNSVLYADVTGAIDWVATLPVEVVSTANLQGLIGCPDVPAELSFLAFVCEIPMMPAEPVATDVVVGPDGAAYVSELKGFPAPTGESRIWRIAPGARHAECGTSSACQVVADGFTSIVDLNFGPDGTLYVTELDEAGWFAAEIGAGLGGTINACEWGSFPLDCEAVATELPIPTSTTVDKDGTLWTTIWSLVPGMADVIEVE